MRRDVDGRTVLFFASWLFIIFVSVVDGYLVWLYRDSILWMEQNPAGVALLAIAGGGIVPLLSTKFLGTIVACSWLQVIFQTNPRKGLTIAVPLACFQLGLLVYLTRA